MKNHMSRTSRTLSHKTGYTNVLKNLKAQSYSSPGGQYGSFNISVKDGGYPELELFQLGKEIWDHLLPCGINYTADYLPNKLNVTADRSQDGPLGMQASSLVVSDNLLTKGNPRGRSICLDLFDLSHQIKT